MDKLAQSIYIFNIEGKYIGKINKRGQGPGEYVNLSYMTVTDSTIVVIDQLFGKNIEYSRNTLVFLREERIFEKIWCTEVFSMPGYIYYINEWSDCASGKYRLFSSKVGSKEFEMHLPFNKEPLAIGIDGPIYGISGNTAVIIYMGDDNIYRVTSEGVYPEYEMIYKTPKVVYTSGKVENVFNDNPSGRVLGISSIQESEKYLFLTPGITGNETYTCIYNKQNSKTTIYNRQTTINSNFDNNGINIKRIINNQIIDWQDAPTLFILNEHVYSKQEFKNQKFKQQLDVLFENLIEESNPVLFIYNLK